MIIYEFAVKRDCTKLLPMRFSFTYYTLFLQQRWIYALILRYCIPLWQCIYIKSEGHFVSVIPTRVGGRGSCEIARLEANMGLNELCWEERAVLRVTWGKCWEEWAVIRVLEGYAERRGGGCVLLGAYVYIYRVRHNYGNTHFIIVLDKKSLIWTFLGYDNGHNYT